MEAKLVASVVVALIIGLIVGAAVAGYVTPPATTTVTTTVTTAAAEKTVTTTVTTTATSTVTATVTAPATPKAYKVAILLPASIDSIGWPQAGYWAIENISERFGVETAYSEWVSVADAGRIAKEYIDAGYNIIIFHGGQYVSVVEELAPQYPDVAFVGHAAEPMDYPNVWTVIRDEYLGYYALGYLMAKISKTKKIGFVGGLEFPSAIAIINLIYIAANKTCPGIKFYYVHTGDFDDPVKNREAAEAQIAEGVDVIIPWLGGTGVLGVLEAAKAAPHHVYLVGGITDMYNIDPERFFTSVLMDITGLYCDIVGQIMAGKMSGSVRLSQYMDLAPTRGMLPIDDEAYAKGLNEMVISGQIEVPIIMDHYIVPPP